MIEVHSTTLDRSIQIDRIIGQIRGKHSGPTVVFLGGIHGNEKSGVFALYRVIEDLKQKRKSIKGNIYAIAGNLNALEQGTRYSKEDLNRLWTTDQINDLDQENPSLLQDEKSEQYEILKTIEKILDQESGPFYFMDLHTTSSETIPFMVVNDSLLNRKFTEQFPVPMILGIEEYLDGPILSYINEMGYVSFGYEAGQHDDHASYQNQIAFIYLCLTFSEIIDQADIDYYHFYERLAKTSVTSRDIFEIRLRFSLDEKDQFKMNPGLVNFQKIYKGQELAVHNGQLVKATAVGRVFMPLYQNQGSDGFFEISRVHPFFLKLSALLRRIKAGHILPYLPGIRWKSSRHEALVVNLKVARFLAKPLMHLLGYRSRQTDKSHLVIKNREAASRTEEYVAEWNN